MSEIEAQLQARVAAEKHDDGTPVEVPDTHATRRFLRARKNNVDAAVKMYIAGLRSRAMQPRVEWAPSASWIINHSHIDCIWPIDWHRWTGRRGRARIKATRIFWPLTSAAEQKWRKASNIDASILGPDPHEHVYRALVEFRHHKYDKKGLLPRFELLRTHDDYLYFIIAMITKYP